MVRKTPKQQTHDCQSYWKWLEDMENKFMYVQVQIEEKSWISFYAINVLRLFISFVTIYGSTIQGI